MSIFSTSTIWDFFIIFILDLQIYSSYIGAKICLLISALRERIAFAGMPRLHGKNGILTTVRKLIAP
jgi:hypothetical protein